MPRKRMSRRRIRAAERAPVGAGPGDSAFLEDARGAAEPERDAPGEPAPDARAGEGIADAQPAVKREPQQEPRLQELRRREIAGDVRGVIEILRGLVLEQPRSVALRVRLGRVYDEADEPVLALEQFQAAREVDDTNVDVLAGLGRLLAGNGRFDAAERELRRALRLDPERADVHGNLGVLYFKRGLYGQAEVELKRATELDPGSPAAHFYRGEALNQLGRVDEALEMLERAVALDSSNARAFYTMGILYDKKNLPHQAEAMYRRSREVSSA